jgi:hypothetical protein
MAEFDYICQDKSGQHFRGERIAENEHDLAHRLQVDGYFMVWCRENDVVGSVTFSDDSLAEPLTPITEAQVQTIIARQGKWGRRSSDSDDHSQPKTSKLKQGWYELTRLINLAHLLGALAGILIGVGAGYWWVNRPTPLPKGLEGMDPRFWQVVPGMHRSQVEQLFPIKVKYAIQLSTKAIYAAEGPFDLEVYYDELGGNKSPDNRVQKIKMLKAIRKTS